MGAHGSFSVALEGTSERRYTTLLLISFRKAASMSLRNAVLVSLFCVVLCGPTILLCAEKGGVGLPYWITAEDAIYLSGDGTKGNISHNLNIQAFSNGVLQEEIQKTFEARIPLKAIVMMSNASLQRCAIELSNTLFSWESYPTYYGSEILLHQKESRLSDTPATMDSKTLKQIDSGVEAAEQFAAKHPRLSTFLFVPPDSTTMQSPTVVSQFSNPLTYDDLMDHIQSATLHTEVIDGQIGYDEFVANWYKTDHHWTALGAYNAYTRIIEAIASSENPRSIARTLAYDEPSSWGTFARRGLIDSISDETSDVVLEDEPTFRVTIDGETKGDNELLLHRQLYREARWDAHRYISRYGEFFHKNYGLIQIECPESSDRPELLIVADSYANSFERFMACHFSAVWVIDPRFAKEGLDSFLETHPKIDSVLFLMMQESLGSEDFLKYMGA